LHKSSSNFYPRAQAESAELLSLAQSSYTTHIHMYK
jgi:hypothetical protein